LSIPSYQKIMLPLLKYMHDQNEHSIRDSIEHLSNVFQLSSDEREEMFPSGNSVIFNNRVQWARAYLVKAGLIEAPRRGVMKISQSGLNVLSQNLNEITIKFLNQYPEFVEFKGASKKDDSDELESYSEVSEQQTPEEILEYSYQKIKQDLAENVLIRVKGCTPIFFEKLVVELLLKMGYGGSRKDAGQAIGKSGDGGIDGIIKEDRLGLDVIYIQAKRWDNVVGRPEIQKFAGALQGQRAKKGIFITTSYFSNEAKDFVKSIDSKIVLIDGEQLAQMMIDNEIGVTKIASYDIKKIDSDYFIDD
jgi:restriction system protein